MKRIFKPLTLLCLGVCACSDSTQSTAPMSVAPSSFATLQVSGTPISGRYIVGFKNNVSDVDREARRIEVRHRGVLRMTYKSALKGMTLSLSDAAADSLRNDPNVAFVEQDRTISMANVQAAGGWGLDRVDQRGLPLNGMYSFGSDGTGVTAYILDSGINFTHTDFGGRATTGTDIMTPGGTATDCHGHGSTVSGVVGGSTYGVAKNVKLVAVRIVDCNGNSANSTTIAGIDWVTAHRVLPAVANLSLQNVYSAALNQSIANAVAAGVTFVVAAGNSSADACNASPSSAPAAIVVGATDINDGFASFSNFGPCVTLLAPGVNIPGPTIGSNTATKTWSGTSFSSPHVAGLAALYLQTHPTATPAQVRSWLVSNATPSKISSVPGGTSNLLAYSPQVASTNAAPVANFTATCPTMQCTFDASASTDDAGVVTYTWDWGNGRTESRSTPITKNTFATQRTYSITLTVTDAGGLRNSITKQFAVPSTTTPPANQAPVASITAPAASSTVPKGQTVTFSGNGNDPESGALSGSSLQWTSSIDGAIGSGASFAKSNLSAGTHTITLTATDAQGARGTASVTLIVTASPSNQPPMANFSANCANPAYPHQCAFDATTSTDDVSIASYKWDWGNGRSESRTLPTTKNTWAASGTYVITLTVTDGAGLTSSLSKSVVIP